MKTCFLLLVVFCLIESHYCDVKEKPNVIVIVADDLGWNDVSFHGFRQIPTPNIDALAKDGVILNNYYVSPMCTPSRGSLMTGKHPIKIGLQHEVIVADAPWGLSTKEKIFPQFFNELGYESHGVGKWHLGFYKEKYLPTKRGFKSFFGYWTGVKDYYTHFANMPNMSGFDLHDDGDPYWGYNGTYGTDIYTLKTKELIENHDKSKPLFLYLAQQAVHSGNYADPLQAPENYLKPFSFIKDSKRKLYAGMVSALDASIGEIFASLRKARMLHNTIIAFTTDNGGAIQGADGNAGSNYPLRGCKYNVWEGGIRGVSFIWSEELRLKSRVSDHLMHVSDWLPTLYAAAGADVRRLGSIDGYNLWPSLTHNLPSPRTDVLHNIDDEWDIAGVRKNNYKLVKGSAYEGRFDSWYDREGRELIFEEDYDDDDDSDEDEEVASEEMLEQYKLTYEDLLKKSKVAKILWRKYHKPPTAGYECSEECEKSLIVKCGPRPSEKELKCEPKIAPCLFDIKTDPCEYHNIASQLPEVVKELEDLIKKYDAQAVPPRNKPSDPAADPKLHCNAWVPWKSPKAKPC